MIDQSGSLTGVKNSVLMTRLSSQYMAPPSRVDPDFQVKAAQCPFNPTLGFYQCSGAISWATVV